MAIDPYVPGRSKAASYKGEVFKLSSNETPLGPSPESGRGLWESGTEHLEAYPDGGIDRAARSDRRALRARSLCASCAVRDRTRSCLC